MSDELKYSVSYVDLGVVWWSAQWAAAVYPMFHVEDEFWRLR